MVEAALRGTTPVSRTISSHVSRLVTVETLAGVTPWSVSASSPYPVVRFLVVRLVWVRGWRHPFIGTKLVQTHTVGLLTQSVRSRSTWYPKRQT